jgi:hypothetical protein
VLMLRRVILYLAATMTVVVILQAQPAGQVQPAIDALGPAVGARVPDLTGVDQFGQRQTLQTVLGPEGALLVFFRSADW